MKLTKVLIVLIAAVLVLPALAGEGDSSWFLGFDLMASRPSNVPTAWVLQDPDDDGDPEGQIRSLEPSHDFSGRVWFGQNYGDDKGGWYVAYTGMESEETDSVSSGSGGELWDILYNADNADDDFTGKASAISETEAETIDIGYFRPIHTSERLHTGWNMGLRHGSLDNDLMVDYRGVNEIVMNESETDGIGVRLGMNAAVKLCEKLWLGGGVAMSYLSGETESSSLHFDTTDSSPDVNVRHEFDTSFSVIEAHIGLRWNISDLVSLRFGYEFQEWNNALSSPTFPDDVSEGFLTNQTSDVTWDSFTVGVGFRFGGGKNS